MLAVPCWPSEVAVIEVVPALTPVTNPVGDTTTFCDAPELQVISRPESGLPAESSAVAVNC